MAQRISPFASLKPTEKDLDFVAVRAGDNWRSLLTHLGIKLVDIDSFQNHYGRTTKDACFKGLVHWLKGNVPDEPVTFGTLSQALEDSAMTGCISLLEEKLEARSRLNRADQDLSTQTNNVPCSRQAVAHRVTESESRPSSLHSSLSKLTDTVISAEEIAAASRLGIVAALDLSEGTPPTRQKPCKDRWRARDPPHRRLHDAFLRLQSRLASLFDNHISGLKPYLRFCQKRAEWPYKKLTVKDINEANTFQDIFNIVCIEDFWLNTDMLSRLIECVPDKKIQHEAEQHLEAYHKLLGVFTEFVLLKCIPENDAHWEHFRSSLLPMLRITYDKNYHYFTVSELLKQREFLSTIFDIPIEVFHYVKAQSTNSTLVTWALSISSEKVFTIFQRAAHEFWSLKENSVISFEIEGILQLHLRGKDLLKLIKEALQCNYDFLSCTEHFSRQLLALVDYSHPKRRSSEMPSLYIKPLLQDSVPLSEPGVQELTWPSNACKRSPANTSPSVSKRQPPDSGPHSSPGDAPIEDVAFFLRYLDKLMGNLTTLGVVLGLSDFAPPGDSPSDKCINILKEWLKRTASPTVGKFCQCLEMASCFNRLRETIVPTAPMARMEDKIDSSLDICGVEEYNKGLIGDMKMLGAVLGIVAETKVIISRNDTIDSQLLEILERYIAKESPTWRDFCTALKRYYGFNNVREKIERDHNSGT